MDATLCKVNALRAQHSQPPYSHQELILQATLVSLHDQKKTEELYKCINEQDHVHTYFLESMLQLLCAANTDVAIVFDTKPLPCYQLFKRNNLPQLPTTTSMWQILNFAMPIKLFVVVSTQLTCKQMHKLKDATKFTISNTCTMYIFQNKICQSFAEYKKKCLSMHFEPYMSIKAPFVYIPTDPSSALINM